MSARTARLREVSIVAGAEQAVQKGVARRALAATAAMSFHRGRIDRQQAVALSVAAEGVTVYDGAKEEDSQDCHRHLLKQGGRGRRRGALGPKLWRPIHQHQFGREAAIPEPPDIV